LSGGDESPDVSDRISTGCSAIDDLLGGGFERGAVTQLYGPPAAGKTNLALSAAVELAADGDSTLYLDTEDLSIERLKQLAEATAGEDRPPEGLVDELPGDGDSDGDAGMPDVDAIASRILITEAHTFEQQEEAVRDAEDLASQVELIVLDSATGFYRLERTEQEDGEALRAVGRQLAHLLSLARKHDLAVVYTNQVFADPESDATRALGGNTLDHWSGTILRVDRFRGGNRRGTLEKHRSKAAGETATFKITQNGLRAVDR
jgi:DNA repair protein RadB